MYDAIIIGRDLSSLIAALTCVRKGRETVLAMEGDPEMAYREAGYVFPFDPRPLSGLVDQQIFSRFLREMLPVDDYISSSQLMNPAFQVILSGHRVDLFPDWGRLIHELIREFPGEEREIDRFYRAVSKADRLVQRWILEDETSRLGVIGGILRQLARLPAAITGHSSLVIQGGNGKDNAFKRTIEAQLNFLSHLEMDGDSLPLSAAYLLSLPVRGLFYPRGGMITLMSRLRRAFTEHGGVLMDGCSVIRIETEPEVAVDLECEGSSSTLHGRKLIVSAQWEKLELLLPGRKVLPGPNRRFASIHPAAYPFCLHMGVHEEGLPESMAPYVVVVRDGTGSVTNRDLVFLQTSLPGETDSAPEGRRAISATVYLVDSPLRLNDQELKNAAMGIIDSLEEFLPFLRDNIDYLRVDQSIFLSRKYQEMVSRKYRTQRRLFFGMNTFSPQTRLPNVLLTGGILRAGLGFEGEIIAGMDAAFRAEQGS
jgi:phytoene dehydrogenase-like protein